jgi:AcrR family transcriptional regulator
MAERADAARNRRAIMAATEELLERYEPSQVSIERIAAAAGVGKATVFHRFGSRAELMQTLAHERADALRAAILTGPPPLGPGAPPRDRLMAFIDAVVEHASRHIGLVTAAEQATLASKQPTASRQEHPVYVFWHGHVASLLASAKPGIDADLQAHVILGSLHEHAFARLLRAGEKDRVAAALRELVGALVTSGERRDTVRLVIVWLPSPGWWAGSSSCAGWRRSSSRWSFACPTQKANEACGAGCATQPPSSGSG